MFKEILLGICIAGILVYLAYLYLEWCSRYASARDLYGSNPLAVLKADKEVLNSYGNLIMPTYLADSYKPLRFWILYYSALYL